MANGNLVKIIHYDLFYILYRTLHTAIKDKLLSILMVLYFSFSYLLRFIIAFIANEYNIYEQKANEDFLFMKNATKMLFKLLL